MTLRCYVTVYNWYLVLRCFLCSIILVLVVVVVALTGLLFVASGVMQRCCALFVSCIYICDNTSLSLYVRFIQRQ